MKKSFLLLFCSIACMAAFAQSIGEKEALLLAKQFLGEDTRAGHAHELSLSHTYTSSKQENNLYVFNQDQNGGFIVVAADERVAEPILGYSEEGRFDFENAPANLRWWLSEYSRQIDFLRENVAEGSVAHTAQNATRAATIAVHPLLGETKWNQESPYNKLCPDGCPTGCVATAMAQIMRYHRWPAVGRGSHAYELKGNIIEVDFSQSHYQWDLMLDNYEGSKTDEQVDAVAKLMYDCGVSVDMEYTKDGSGAVSEDVPRALVTYFDYSDDCEFIDRDANPDGWDEKIAAELEASRPVYYSGRGTSGGHAFVADGYYVENGRYYFHINWGWGGADNSWFQSTVLQMTHDYSFNSNQGIAVGISPNKRVKVDGLYYGVLNDHRASVSYPEKTGDYKGNVVVPASVKIDGVDYAVETISSSAFCGCKDLTSLSLPSSLKNINTNAFVGCENLKSLEVAWTEDLPDFLFEAEFMEKVELVVPEGTLETYSSTQPWMMFKAKVDKAGKTVVWGDWQPFETGVGNFDYSLFESGTQKNMNIECRAAKEDPNKFQIRIQNWLKNADPYFVFTYDAETQKCEVPIQHFDDWYYYYNEGEGEEKNTKYGELYVSDIPSYDDEETYRSFPCKYDPVAGVFSLNLAYFIGSDPDGTFGVGYEYFRLQGEYKDFSLSIDDVKSIVEKTDRTATQKMNLTGGADVAQFSYAVVEGALTDSLAEEVARKMAEGAIETKVKKKGLMNLVTLTYPAPGMYTVVVISQDAEGKYFGNFDLHSSNFMYGQDWKSIGMARYTEDLLASEFDVDTCTYEVEVEQNVAQPGRFRMKNPYGKNFSMDLGEEYHAITDADSYIEINATDPEGVYIPHGQSMNLTFEDDGEMLLGSSASYMIMDEGKTLEELKKDGYCGTLKDGVITFPSKEYEHNDKSEEDESGEEEDEEDKFHGVLLVRYPTFGSDKWFYVGRHFRLDMSGLDITPVAPIRKDVNQLDDIFDLQGRKMPQGNQKKYKGIYIVGGKKVYK